MRKTWLRALACCLTAVLAMTLSSLMLFASEDEEREIVPYEPEEHQVADRTVHLNVNKLDSADHEYVPGCKLEIKDGNETVVAWESGTTTAKFDRVLDVDKEYTLVETNPADGYKTAKPVVFKLRSVNFETKGEVISGEKTDDGETNAEFSNVSGDVDNQAFVITLYNTKVANERTVTRTETRPNTNTKQNEQHTSNQQTNNRNQTVQNQNQTQNEVTTEDEETPAVRRTSSSVVTEETPTENNTTPQNTNEVRVLSTERIIQEGDQYVDSIVNGGERRGGGTLTGTGDSTSYVPMVVVIVLGIGAVIGAIVIRRRK